MAQMKAHGLAAACLALVACGPAWAADPLVSGEWLAAHRGDAHVVVLDLRPEAAYRAGHIPGAVSADYGTTGWMAQTKAGAVGALPPVETIAARIGALGVGDADQAVVVGEDFAASARVYWTFKVLGHTEVSILDGGWHAWAGPVASGPVARAQATFTPHYNSAIRAELPEVAAALAHGGVTLVDARPLSQWNGTAKSPVVREGGHLPGAISVDQSSAIAPDGRLKPRDTLALLFAQAAGKPAIAYCNAGHLSASDWFVLSEILHQPDTKLYDGSMSEWAADPSRPVVK